MTTDRNSEGAVLVPRHYAENIGYAAAVLEQSGCVIDRHNAPPLRTLMGLLAATSEPVQVVAWLALSKLTGEVEIAEPNEKAPNPKYWTDAFPVYTTPPASIPAAEVQALVERWRGEMHRPPADTSDESLTFWSGHSTGLGDCADELAKLIPRNPE